jgi:hypothetical protein
MTFSNKYIIILLLIINFPLLAQYKDISDKEYNLNRTTNNLILGIFNPKNFTMNHSFQVSMISSRYGNMSLTSYLNTMTYKFSDRISVSADVRLQYSPYANSNLGNDFSKRLQNDLNGISLSRFSFDYKISDAASISFQYRKFDDYLFYDYYNNPYSRFGGLFDDKK